MIARKLSRKPSVSQQLDNTVGQLAEAQGEIKRLTKELAEERMKNTELNLTLLLISNEDETNNNNNNNNNVCNNIDAQNNLDNDNNNFNSDNNNYSSNENKYYNNYDNNNFNNNKNYYENNNYSDDNIYDNNNYNNSDNDNNIFSNNYSSSSICSSDYEYDSDDGVNVAQADTNTPQWMIEANSGKSSTSSINKKPSTSESITASYGQKDIGKDGHLTGEDNEKDDCSGNGVADDNVNSGHHANNGNDKNAPKWMAKARSRKASAPCISGKPTLFRSMNLGVNGDKGFNNPPDRRISEGSDRNTPQRMPEANTRKSFTGFEPTISSSGDDDGGNFGGRQSSSGRRNLENGKRRRISCTLRSLTPTEELHLSCTICKSVIELEDVEEHSMSCVAV